MADPFSIAAGVAGVVSLSLQLVQTSHKLSRILKSITDLPDEVEGMVMELEILSDALQQDCNASVAGRKATQQLQKLLKRLQSLLDDTQTYISRAKHKVCWEAIQATMRKDEINQLYQRMAGCLRLLQVVNQMDFHTSQTRRLGAIQQSQSIDTDNIALILNHVSKLTINAQRHETSDITIHKTSITDNAVINRSTEMPKNRNYGNIWDSIACWWLIIGFVHFYQNSSKNRRITDDGFSGVCNVAETLPWKIKFQAARWLTSRGFTVWSTACFGDWQYHYRPHRLRPKDAPIFEACRSGKVEDVRRLLSRGEASPFDIDEEGLTPLHHAVQFYRVDVCRLLVSSGADCNERLNDIPNLLIWLSLRRPDQEEHQGRSTWFQLVRLLVEEGQCDPTTAHRRTPNFILHKWYGPLETLVWLFRQDNFWFEIPVDGGLGRTYHSLANDIPNGGPNILLNVLWTEERAPYILHSKDHVSRTVLFAAVWRQAWLATFDCRSPQCCDSTLDQLVTRLIRDGSDVHALDSLGSTPLDNALRLFAIYCDKSPLRALNFAHENREVFRIERKQRKQPENSIAGSRSGSKAQLDGSTNNKGRFMQFLDWWFDKLDEGGCSLNDYVRRENLQRPMCKISRDGAAFGAQISKTIHYDDAAQTLELDMECAWTKVGGSKESKESWYSVPRFAPRHVTALSIKGPPNKCPHARA